MAVYNMMPKCLPYRVNGTGRDTYISIDNGGMYVPQKMIPEYPVSSFPYRRQFKAVNAQLPSRKNRYNSNGTGRDMYIMSNSGGFEFSSGHPRNLRFEGSLRSYGNMSKTYSWFPKKDRLRSRIMYSHQSLLNRRLSQPKISK